MTRPTMNVQNVLLLLVGLCVVFQGSLLYTQYRQTVETARQNQPIQPAASDAWIDITGMPTRGDGAATVVLIEFADYECPFCRRHAAEVELDLLSMYVETGQIRYVFGQHPLAMHSHAELLSTAAVCAQKQGQYWQMHDALFQEQPTTRDELARISDTIGIDATALLICLDSPDTTEQIQRDIEVAEDLGLTGTPAFALGVTGSDGRVRLLSFIIGAQPLSTFVSAIDTALGENRGSAARA